MTTGAFERSTIISGVGQSQVGRRLHRSPLDLTIEAARLAVHDAGLVVSDIDGICTYPGGDAVLTHGHGGPAPAEVQDALGTDLQWYSGSGELPGQSGALVQACMAVAVGLCDHVLVYRTVTESTARDWPAPAPPRRDGHSVATGPAQWMLPYGGHSPANWLAPMATRHVHDHGLTREQLGQIAVVQRQNAQRNPSAVMRDDLTLEDYLGARMISTPLCLYDCDVPVDGSTAFVVSRRSHAGNGRSPAVHVHAFGSAMRGRPSWDQYADLDAMAASGAAAHLWERSDLRPDDVDVAQLYDGFSILALVWLEALGFCERGDGGAFVEGGGRISLDGKLPLNTGGGQLSEGRLHGFGLVREACIQLRGHGGARQVSATPRVAVVATGGGPIAGALLLTSEA